MRWRIRRGFPLRKPTGWSGERRKRLCGARGKASAKIELCKIWMAKKPSGGAYFTEFESVPGKYNTSVEVFANFIITQIICQLNAQKCNIIMFYVPKVLGGRRPLVKIMWVGRPTLTPLCRRPWHGLLLPMSRGLCLRSRCHFVIPGLFLFCKSFPL